MSGVIAVPHHDPWLAAGRNYRTLLERAIPELAAEEDVFKLRQALALSGLHFDLLEKGQASRIARVLGRVADELRLELQAQIEDEWARSFADSLAQLEMLLHDLYA